MVCVCVFYIQLTVHAGYTFSSYRWDKFFLAERVEQIEGSG